MAQQVVGNALLKCSFGAAPATLIVLPANAVQCGGAFAATIMDHIPITNIPTFGMCSAPTNPAVVAKAGSPAPCVPIIPAPWVPGAPTVLIGNQPALDSTSKCLCTFLGIVTVTNPGQMPTEIP